MANAKEISLVFMLRAQLDASMQQFSTVGRQIKELEEQVQKYNKTLSDIEAYRKQSKSLSDMEAKLQEAAEQQREASRAHSEAINRHNAAKEAVQRHETEIERLNSAITEEKLRIKEEVADLRAGKAGQDAINKAKQESTHRIAELERQLQRETAEQKRSEAALKQTDEAQRKATQAMNSAQHAHDRLKEKTAQERDALNQMDKALRAAKVDTDDLAKSEERLKEEAERTNEKLERLAAFENGVNALADRFNSLAAAATEANKVLEPLMGFFVDSARTAGNLEYAISAVRAVSGATQEETARMTEAVREMGRTTVYTAEEAAGAMQNMALAGWDPKQMIAGLPAVVKLAAASGEEIAQVTSIVSDGMNAFQLTGEQAAVKFADVLAKAATSSNTNVGLLGESLSYVETTAGNLGYSIEDVSVALAAMANNALKGGVSGSALNTMLTRMSGANETAAAEMERLGLSMYDATGQAKPLLQFIGELRTRFREFGDNAQEAQISAYKLAGQRGMRGLLAIVNQTDAQFQALTEDVYHFSGAADQISDIRLENFNGKLKLMEDAWTDLKVTIGNEFIPTASDAVELLTDLTNGANEFAENHGGLVRSIAATGGALKLMADGAIAAAPAMAALKFLLTGFSAATLLPILGGVGVAAVLAGAGVALFTDESIQSQREGSRFAKQLDKQADGLEKNREEAEQAARVYEKQREYAGRLIDGLDGLRDSYKNGEITAAEMQLKIDELNAALPGLGLSFDAASGNINKTTEELRAFNDELREGEEDAQADFIETLLSGLDDYRASLAEAVQKRDELLRSLKEKYGDKITVNDDYTIKVRSTTEDINRHHITVGFLEQGSLRDLNEQIERYNGLIKDAEAELEEEEKKVRAKTLAKMEALGIEERFYDVYTTTEDSLKKVAAAYQEVYAELGKAYDKQFAITEAVKEEKIGYDDLLEAQRTQLQFWNERAKNLKTIQKAAQDAGVDISVMWNELTTPSTSAAGMAEALAKEIQESGAGALKEYKDLYDKRVEAEQAALQQATSVYQEEVDKALAEMEKNAVDAMKETGMPEAARSAMSATFDTTLAEISKGEGKVYAALKNAAERWKLAILSGFDRTVSPYNGYVSTSALRGFASGTDNAPRGVALVGEEGPELMFLRGGEQIVPADKTREMLYRAVAEREQAENSRVIDFPHVKVAEYDSGGITVNVSPTYNVEAGADADRLQAVFDRNNEQLKRLILKTVEEAQRDARRRAFA